MEKGKVFFFFAGPTRADEDFTPQNLDNSRKQAPFVWQEEKLERKKLSFPAFRLGLISGYGKPGEIENLTAKKKKKKGGKAAFRLFLKNFISSLSTDDKCAFAEKNKRSTKKREFKLEPAYRELRYTAIYFGFHSSFLSLFHFFGK